MTSLLETFSDAYLFLDYCQDLAKQGVKVNKEVMQQVIMDYEGYGING